MKSPKQLVTILVFGALACMGLQAQSVNLRATIPFGFTAGEIPMAAGQYLIQSFGGAIRVIPLDGKHHGIYLMTKGPLVPNYSVTPRLQFTRYGDDYFLASIWNAELPKSAPEKEASRRLDTKLETSVLASKN